MEFGVLKFTLSTTSILYKYVAIKKQTIEVLKIHYIMRLNQHESKQVNKKSALYIYLVKNEILFEKK